MFFSIVGKELAEQSEILEAVGEQDPSEFYYGQGQDDWLDSENIRSCDPALSTVLNNILRDMKK